MYHDHDLDPDSALAKLEINARAYSFDPILDRVADLIEQGPVACAGIHPRQLDLASIHRDFRDHYRRAVAAGAIRDDRGPKGEDQR